MRSFVLHPIVFYPLVALLAVLMIAVSVKPQSWPRAAAQVGGQRAGETLVLEGAAFNAPQVDPAQTLRVTRTFSGEAQTLRIAVLPHQAAPGPNDHGVRILLTPAAVRMINNRPVSIDVSYTPLPVNAAASLAVSLQGGAGGAVWMTKPTPPQTGSLRFDLPAASNIDAIGLRAISDAENEAFGLEITRILVVPHPAGATAH